MDTQARIEAARALMRTRVGELAEIKKLGPPCTKCWHYRPSDTGPPRCGHPVFERHDYNAALGKLTVEHSADIFAARDAGGLCGPGAALFMRWPLSRIIPAAAFFGAGATMTLWSLLT